MEERNNKINKQSEKKSNKKKNNWNNKIQPQNGINDTENNGKLKNTEEKKEKDKQKKEEEAHAEHLLLKCIGSTSC